MSDQQANVERKLIEHKEAIERLREENDLIFQIKILLMEKSHKASKRILDGVAAGLNLRVSPMTQPLGLTNPSTAAAIAPTRTTRKGKDPVKNPNKSTPQYIELQTKHTEVVRRLKETFFSDDLMIDNLKDKEKLKEDKVFYEAQMRLARQGQSFRTDRCQ
jgi:hypothetical protein